MQNPLKLHFDCVITKHNKCKNHKSIQRQVKTGVPQGGVQSPTLFNIHTTDIPTPTASVQVMLYADDITITSTHTSMSAARKYIQPYLVANALSKPISIVGFV